MPIGEYSQRWRKRWIFPYLPCQTQAILATSSESLDTQAIMADKIGGISSFYSNNIAAIQGTDEIIELRNQISALTTAESDFKIHRNRRHSRSNSRYRYWRSRGSSQQVCYYHRKFGNNARCCLAVAKLQRRSLSVASERSQTINRLFIFDPQQFIFDHNKKVF